MTNAEIKAIEYIAKEGAGMFSQQEFNIFQKAIRLAIEETKKELKRKGQKDGN